MATPPLVTGSEFDAFKLTALLTPAPYDNTKTYAPNATVTLNGSLFQARVSSTGVSPSSATPPVTTANWTLILTGGTTTTTSSAGLSYTTIPASDFNALVSGVTVLPSQPATPSTLKAAFYVDGGDIYMTLTGTTPASGSPTVANGSYVELTNTDIAAMKAAVAAGTPRLNGFYQRGA